MIRFFPSGSKEGALLAFSKSGLQTAIRWATWRTLISGARLPVEAVRLEEEFSASSVNIVRKFLETAASSGMTYDETHAAVG